MLRALKPRAWSGAAKVRTCECRCRRQRAILRASQKCAEFARCRRDRPTAYERSCGARASRCEAKRSIHALSVGCTAVPASSARQGIREQLADARQELRAHGGMKPVRVARADRQKSQSALGAERRERDRADLDRSPCRRESRAARRGPVRIGACPTAAATRTSSSRHRRDPPSSGTGRRPSSVARLLHEQDQHRVRAHRNPRAGWSPAR